MWENNLKNHYRIKTASRKNRRKINFKDEGEDFSQTQNFQRPQYFQRMKNDLNNSPNEDPDSSLPHKYNLILSNKGRYLEVSSAICPSGATLHIPTIKFDKICKRDSFLCSGTDVNEQRFKFLKEPEIWTKIKRIPTVKISTNSHKKGHNCRSVLNIEPDMKNYYPNKEPTMLKLDIWVPSFKLNSNNDRTGFLNIWKEMRPEGYEMEKAREKQKKVKTFSIRKQKNRDMKM